MKRNSVAASRLSDDDKVKAKLVRMIEAAKDNAVADVALLATAYTKLRAMELKLEEGAWGEDLVAPEQPTAPQ